MDSEAYTMQWPSDSATGADSESSENATTHEGHIPNKVNQFYLVKLHPYENPNLFKLENLIVKLGQDRILTNLNRQEKLDYRDKLQWSLRLVQYRRHEWEWERSNLRLLQLCLDKTCFSNKCSCGKAIRPSSTVKEIDRHSLHFGLLHASKSVAEERQILGKIKEVEKMPRHSCISMEDYKDSICRLEMEIYRKFDMKADEKKRISREIEKLERAKEEAIVTAALDGKMWKSLDSKENIKQQIKSMINDMNRRRAEHLKYNAEVIFLKEELKAVEDDLTSLKKHLNDIERLQYEARQCILQWKTEQEEKNASYSRYIELVTGAQELAKRKDHASLQKLSQEEMEKFLFRWSNDNAFQDDYRMRSIASLNERCLNLDGRRRNRKVRPIFVKDPDVSISKSLKRALQKYQKESYMEPL